MDNDSEREDCECDSNYGTLFSAFMRQYFYQGFIFTILCFSREEFSSLSPRPLFKNKRKNARSKVRLLTVFRDTQREKTIVTGIPKSVVLDTLEPPIPSNFHPSGACHTPLHPPPPTPRISAIFSGSDPVIQAGFPGIPKTLKQYEKRYPNQSDIAISENEKTL